MYDGRSGCVNWREKKRAEARLSASTVRSSVRLYRSVDDFHLVAAVPARLGGLGKRAFAAVVVAHHDLVFLFLLDRFLDLVSAEGAADRAEDGGEVLAAAAAHLVAENAADDRAADRADARCLPGLLDGAHVLDYRALAADRGDDDRCRRGRRDGDLFCAMPRLGSRDGLRLRMPLDRLRRLGLRRLLGYRRDGRAGTVLPRRSGYPAHDGSDSDQAEQADRACGEDDERVSATRCFHRTSCIWYKRTGTDVRRAREFV